MAHYIALDTTQDVVTSSAKQHRRKRPTVHCSTAPGASTCIPDQQHDSFNLLSAQLRSSLSLLSTITITTAQLCATVQFHTTSQFPSTVQFNTTAKLCTPVDYGTIKG